MKQTASRVLTMYRPIAEPRTSVSHRLTPGGVSVLMDEDGGCIGNYLKLLEQGDSSQVRFEVEGAPLAAEDILRVGFGDQFPENAGIPTYLVSIGVPQDSIKTVLEAYDLSRVSYLSCAQLPASAQRQLSLLAALRSPAPILILNDPFQPFSGRWREQFASELLENLRGTKRMMIVVNMSFVPQCWQEQPELQVIDVGKMEQEAIQRALDIQEAQKQRAAAAAPQEENASPTAAAAIPLPTKPASGGEPAKPRNLVHETNHYSFLVRLAGLSSFLRGWSGALAALGLVTLIACMAFVFWPALSGSHESFAQFAKTWIEGKETREPPKDLTEPVAEPSSNKEAERVKTASSLAAPAEESAELKEAQDRAPSLFESTEPARLALESAEVQGQAKSDSSIWWDWDTWPVDSALLSLPPSSDWGSPWEDPMSGGPLESCF